MSHDVLAFAPTLSLSDTSVEPLGGDGSFVLRVAIENAGRGNLDDAVVNLVLPRFVRIFERCTKTGQTHREPGERSTTPESLVSDELGRPIPSNSWLGEGSFPGRTFAILYFRVEMDEERSFPGRIMVVAPDLPEVFHAPLEFVHGVRGGA